MMMPPMLQVPGPPMQLPPPPPPPPPQQQQQPPPKYQQQAFQGHRSPGNYMVQIRHQMLASQGMLFDGKRMRKAVHRKTIDYNSSVVRYLENRLWQRDSRDFRAFQPDCLYQEQLVPPLSMLHNPMNCVVTKFVRTSTNKFRCPIFVLTWTPEGRRLVTGASSGEFTLWNGLTFNFETILQAHDSSVRAMMWSHNDTWMVTGDHAGYIKYWQSNMNNVKMFQGHKEPVRGISFCPLDNKFTTCSDDGTVRIWDFQKCHEEKILRGHGADVKCVDWHPQKALIASGSKDNQQPIKLWDPKSGQSLATIHAHKSTVMELKWNRNGNWLLTASRDHLLKLFDIRNMREEMQTFRGHKKEATAIGWHPIHEGLFASGGSDGAIMFWMVGTDKEVGGMEEAHEGMVWSLAWHPMGHILASGSNDHSTKFWTRNRPGDKMRDRYNLNTLPVGVDQENDYDLDQLSMPSLPGMGLDQGSQMENVHIQESCSEIDLPSIPGLDWEADEQYLKQQEAKIPRKRVPYARPVPKQFEQAWLGNKQTGGVHAPDQKEMQKKQGMSQQASSDNTEQPQSNQAPPHMMKGNMLMPPSVGPLQPPLTLGPMGQVVTSVPPGPQSNMMAPPPGVPPVSVPLSRFPPQFPPGQRLGQFFQLSSMTQPPIGGQYPNQMPRSSNMGPPPRAGFGGPHMIHGGSQMMHPNQHMQQPPIRPGSEQQHQLRPDGPSPQQSMFASPPDQGLHPGRWMPQPDSSEEGSSKDQDYRQINNNQTDGNFTSRGRGGNPPRGRHDMGARNRGRGQPFYNNAPPGQERTDHWQGNGKQGDENQYISKESNFANDIDERVDRGRGRNFPRGRGRGGYGNVQHMSNIPPHHQDIDERVMMVEHGHPSMKDMQGMDNQNPRKKPWEDGNQHLRGRGGGKGPHRGSLDPRAAKFSRQDHQGDFSGGGNMYNQDLPGQRSGYRGGRGRGGDRGRGYYRGGRGR